ncbi:MAG: hypothetical protein ACREQ5_25655 [Candidatus Dormibacteria bacterium]
MHTIVMKVISHLNQRYNTLGDYWEDPDGTWQFRVSDMGDWRYNFSVLLHEFVEYAIMKHVGITEEEVLAFDLAVKPNSKYSDDPGMDPKAPYHKEHVYADCMERLIAPHLGMDFTDPWAAADKLPKWRKMK